MKVKKKINVKVFVTQQGFCLFVNIKMPFLIETIIWAFHDSTSLSLGLLYLVLWQFDFWGCHTLHLAIVDPGESVRLSYFNFLLGSEIQNDLIFMLIFHSVQIHYKMCYRSNSEISVIIIIHGTQWLSKVMN